MMDKKESNDYVTELLKQLEELKRKKAHKERKLMKLKSCSPKAITKDKNLNDSLASSSKNAALKVVDEVSKQEKKTDDNENHSVFAKSHYSTKRLHSFHTAQITESCNINKSRSQKNALNDVKASSSQLLKNKSETAPCTEDKIDNSKDNISFSAENVPVLAHKSDVTVKENSISLSNKSISFDVKNSSEVACKSDTNIKDNSKNQLRKSVSFAAEDNSEIASKSDMKIKQNSKSQLNRNVSFDLENIPGVSNKSNVKIKENPKSQLNKSTSSVIENVNNVTKETNVDIVKHAESPKIVSAFQPLTENKCSNEIKLDSGKLSEMPCGKSKSSDELNDSFNVNMSCFFNSSAFDECNSKEETIKSSQESVFKSSKHDVIRRQEVGSELINSDLKISPPFSLNPNESQQINYDVFNFPKFSTPTDLIISSSNSTNSVTNNMSENLKACTSSKFVSETRDNIALINENASSVVNADGNKVVNNKFDSSHLNRFLGSGLSSVLDAHYGSPVKEKPMKSQISCSSDNNSENNLNTFLGGSFKDPSKKRKLESVEQRSNFFDSPILYSKNELDKNKKFAANEESAAKSKSGPECDSAYQTHLNDNKVISDELDFDNSMLLNSDPFTDSQTKTEVTTSSPLKNSNNKVSTQVIEAVDGLLAKVCENAFNKKPLQSEEIIETSPKSNNNNENITFDSEILVIPETEGLGLFFSKDTEEFLETSPLSESFRHFKANENLLNTSSQSRLTTPVVNNIVSAVKSSYDHSHNAHNINQEGKSNWNTAEPFSTPKRRKDPEHKLLSVAHQEASAIDVSSQNCSMNVEHNLSFNKRRTLNKQDLFQIPALEAETEKCSVTTLTNPKSVVTNVASKNFLDSKNNCSGNITIHEKENKLRKESVRIHGCENEKLNEPLVVGSFYDSLAMDSCFLEDDTQDLGKLKHVPYMNAENIQEANRSVVQQDRKDNSNLNFTFSLHGAANEPVMDAEIIVFNDVKYAFLQHKTQIHVWRQEREKWIKIFYHLVEDKLCLDKICISRDGENLVVVMLLSDDQKCCLQFLLFEKDAKVIKLMENTHWLEERHSKDLVLLCGLDGLMFATAQCTGSYEVALHTFIGLKENPRLMTAILGSTDTLLCSLCKIDKLPNALMGINDSMLYIWHILEARLVTAVSLHPHDYLPIKNCIWATVEKGLVYFITTCEGTKDLQMCQLLAANLATGFCQSAMTYTTLPSDGSSKTQKILKATYLEPFLVVAHPHGAYLWSVTEEFCCAALSSETRVTTVAISRDSGNWGLLAVGNSAGCIHCYSLN